MKVLRIPHLGSVRQVRSAQHKDYFADYVSIDIWLIHISRGYRISCEIIKYF